MRNLEINCRNCGKTALVRAEPVYEGFRRTGEAFVCLGCGFRYPSEAETPFAVHEAKPDVFTAEEKRKAPSIFGEEEFGHSCRWCAHYVVNPFDQRCGLTGKTVDATDVCFKFLRKNGSGAQ